jgi:hypothetical protein
VVDGKELERDCQAVGKQRLLRGGDYADLWGVVQCRATLII